MYQFEDLSHRYPEQFAKYYGDATPEQCAEALELGRRVYTSEGCWHCHSQFVRPVSREEDRWGPVSQTEEYQNVLQRPVMFGTRRVGPDLSREGGRRANDWHSCAFLPAHDGIDRFADARLSLVVRRCARPAEQAGTGVDYLRAVARLVAGELSLLRNVRADGADPPPKRPTEQKAEEHDKG